MAVLEAMAHGLCVVATDVGGVSDLVDECGVLLPVGDLGSLVDALRDVVSDAERRAKLGSCAFRRMQERFDVNLTWRALDELYEELAR
jgi:glycosyltransferase involved in cell wall biosynthesis